MAAVCAFDTFTDFSNGREADMEPGVGLIG